MDELTSADELDWEAARTFLAVKDAGTLDGAAKALGIHHSTVFRRLSRLETLVGTALFAREGRRYRVTAAGQAFEVHARRVEDQLFALQRAVLGSELMPTGVLRLTTLESLLPFVLPALAELEARCPDLIVELDATTETRELDRRDADMALRPSENPPDEAVGRRIASVAWALYRAPVSGRREPGALRYAGTIALMNGPRLSEAGLASLGLGEVSERLRARSVAAMAESVAGGFGTGALPCYIGDSDARLQRAGSATVPPSSALWLLMHPDLRDSARIRAVVELMRPSLELAAPLFAGERPRE